MTRVTCVSIFRTEARHLRLRVRHLPPIWRLLLAIFGPLRLMFVFGVTCALRRHGCLANDKGLWMTLILRPVFTTDSNFVTSYASTVDRGIRPMTCYIRLCHFEIKTVSSILWLHERSIMNVIGQLGTFRVSLLTEPWPLCQILIILALKQDCRSGRLSQILIVCYM